MEQGFTLAEPPDGAGARRAGEALELRLVLTGDLRAQASADGQAVLLAGGGAELRYDHLVVNDATGRTVPAKMRATAREIVLEVADEGAVYPLTIDPVFGQQQQLTANDAGFNDRFGWAVAISGETVVVGAPFDDDATSNNEGAAYVFVRAGTNWTQQQKLTASDAAAGDEFGYAVGISGETIVVGSPKDGSGDQGSIYIFVRAGTTWTQQQRIDAFDAGTDDQYGTAVAISGETVVVGAPLDNGSAGADRGSVYIYVRAGTSWSRQEQLVASDAAAGDQFGKAVAISGGTIVVGAFADDGTAGADQGAAYVFAKFCGFAPTITCPADITVSATAGQCSAQVNFTATGAGTPTPTVTCRAGGTVITSPHTFPLGTTSVTCTAANGFAPNATCSFTVTVLDTQAPIISACPAPIITDARPGLCAATVTYTPPTATDNCGSAAGVVCTPDGSTFPVGTTTITCTASDASPNSPDATCSFTVTVRDTQPPVLSLPSNITQHADTGVCKAVVNYSATATDNCGSATVNCTPPSGASFNVGTTTVNCTASDTSADSHNATGSFTVTVQDTQPPTVGAYPNTLLAPGGSTMLTPAAAPADNCGIASITATAANFAGSLAANATTGALSITNANPPGNYTVNVTVTDNRGLTTQRSFTLTVNTAPTINAVAVARQQGSPAANAQIATVMDAEDAENSLTVTVEGGAMATVNGVTVATLAVNAAGQVTANVVAACTASDANFALTVTDTAGATANATLTVTVTANAPPTVGTYPNTLVAPGGTTTVTPSAAPADNGSIASVTATAAPASFTGTLTGNTMTGAVTITGANPMNSFLITVTVTDNCGATTTQSFTLTVSACGAGLSKTGQNFAATGGTGSFSVQIDAACPWTAVSNDPSFITVTTPAGTVAGVSTVTYTVASHTNTSRGVGTITVAGQTFTVQQGAQFLDVPLGVTFYEEIGKLSAAGVTQGCGGGNYCPDSNVSRDQMAAFLSRALGVFTPPTPGSQRFLDVPPSNGFYAFIEELAVRQITLGCGGGNYCPTAFVSREQMAAFLIRALHAPGYVPPPATQRFADVPPSNIFYAHIEELAGRGITLGCGGGNYCPTDFVTRRQMAAFLVRAFGL